MSYLSFLLSTVLFVPVSHFSAAASLYDNGAPNLVSGYEMTHWIQADQFVVSATSALENVTFWDVEALPDFQGVIVWEILADNQNSPGAVVASGTAYNISHTVTGRLAYPAYPEFVDAFSFGPAVVTAGTYWLALHNGPLSYSSTRNTFWETAANSSLIPSELLVAPFTGPWDTHGPNAKLAFQISGLIVPVVTSISGRGAPVFDFQSAAGQVYRVEYKNNLTDSNWMTLTNYSSVNGTGGSIQIIDSTSDAQSYGHRFYHVVAVQ